MDMVEFVGRLAEVVVVFVIGYIGYNQSKRFFKQKKNK